MRRLPGYSLVEVLIAMFLGALLMTAAFQMMKVGNTVLTRLSAQADMQVARQLCLEPLSQDLRQTVLTSVTITPLPPPPAPSQAVAIALRPEDPSAASSKFVGLFRFDIYYFDVAARNWVSMTWSGGPGEFAITPNPLSVNQRLSADQVNGIVTSTLGARHVLAREITAVRVTPSSFPNAAPGATIAIALDRKHVFDSTDSISATFGTAVTPRPVP